MRDIFAAVVAAAFLLSAAVASVASPQVEAFLQKTSAASEAPVQLAKR